MKKRLIAIGAAMIGVAAVAAVANRLSMGEQSGASNTSTAAGGSCCPAPVQTETQRTENYRCESCGNSYDKREAVAGRPRRKWNRHERRAPAYREMVETGGAARRTRGLLSWLELGRARSG